MKSFFSDALAWLALLLCAVGEHHRNRSIDGERIDDTFAAPRQDE